MKRRSFIKSGMLITAGLPFMNSCRLSSGENIASDELYSLFKNPPPESKPFVRWWWNGDRLSKEEIIRQLDIMKSGGIGGVEINPIALPGENDPMDIPAIEWLSPEWIEMVKTALKAAEERGIICDIIVGSGWPFGAEFLTKEEQTQLMTLTSRKVKGAGTMELTVKELLAEATPRVHSGYDGMTMELYGIRLAPLEMSTFSPAKEIPFNTNVDVLTIEIPEGEYILYALVKITGFQAVINGAPGASGPVLNHYNRDAVDKFLNRMSDKLFPAIRGLKGFRAMFCDSMELEGANWCHDIVDEFKKRAGYDLEPYMPFIMYKVGHMGQAVGGAEITKLSGEAKEEIERVRYDFFTVCMDLVKDRFLIPYTEWCNKHGFKSRVQPYGREFHPLEASFNVDIPECETWIWTADGNKESDLYKRPAYTNVNKYVASAVHYSGKRLVSCEEITNTSAVFNATLERIKLTGDQSNLSGVTHSILHGWNYSPKEAEFPGWIRYGTYLSERNTWWPYFSQWTAYKARLSAVLQNTDYFADIAVMHPLADMWSKYGTVRDPFPNLHYPEYQYKIWGAIHQNGNSCDYISEGIIQNSTFSKGYLQYNKRRYHTLILLKVESIRVETAQALESFIKNGGKIVFVESEPCKSPGMKDFSGADSQVNRLIDRMKDSYPENIFLMDAPGEDVLGWYASLQQTCGIKPYMKIDKPDKFVSQIRHKGEGKDIYFISNYSTTDRIPMQITFLEADKKKAWLWDMETGERIRLKDNGKQTFDIIMNPATSKMIVFDNIQTEGEFRTLPQEHSAPIGLLTWDVEFNHIDGRKYQKTGVQPIDWSEDPSTRDFAGEIIYKSKVNNPADYHYIDLGKVYGVSEVTLNGHSLGNHWYGRHLFRIPDSLLGAPVFDIQIKLTTTTGNYLKSLPNNKVAQAWTRRQDFQPMGITGPIELR
ncbi:MAG: glycoside hydrolase family 2 [Tannerellaceae bacterium]|jgi:hypothetical protein|nr:glycoside hydrolase family 2 [Tannerellaceae bacterium]